MTHQRRPRLGQHFLVSEGHRRRIIEALDLREEDFVIEIGAGGGAMTALLAPRVRHLVAIELDPSLTEALEGAFQGKNVEIVTGDILTTDVADLCRRQRVEKCFVFGNLPYYITSPIIRHLFEFAPSIRGMALLVQREVAERLRARPGSRDYGYLSVLAQLYSDPRIALIVPPGAFSPPPKIQSALVQFAMRSKYPKWAPDDQACFLRFAKRCFAQKRKNLLNNLRASYQRARVIEALASHRLATSTRAEEMTVGQLADLWRDLM